MLEMNLQFFGGRGGASGKSAGGGSKSSSGLGALEHTYRDGTKEYVKSNSVMPASEAKNEFRLMENVIMSNAVDTLGGKRSDIEFDRNTGVVTKYVEPTKKNDFIRKQFYQTEVSGDLITDVKVDGTKSSYYKNTKYSFKFIGDKM